MALWYLEKMEEIDKELTMVIEDFDHAVYVEALRLAGGSKSEAGKRDGVHGIKETSSAEQCSITRGLNT